MKYFSIAIVTVIIIFSSCKSNTNTKIAEQTISSKTNDTTSMANSTTMTDTFSTVAIVNKYLELKNALANDNGNKAASACKELLELLHTANTGSFTPALSKTYTDISQDMKENAEHISENADKLEHQREHFQMLSTDLKDLVKTFGTGGKTLYSDFCPMANDGKGALWVSETKEISNPYMGKKMATCGEIKETIKP